MSLAIEEEDKRRSDLSGLPTTDWQVPYWLVDASFATMLILLAATEVGLGALFFRLHGKPADVLAGFGAPPERAVIGAVAIGYPESTDRTGSPTR